MFSGQVVPFIWVYLYSLNYCQQQMSNSKQAVKFQLKYSLQFLSSTFIFRPSSFSF